MLTIENPSASASNREAGAVQSTTASLEAHHQSRVMEAMKTQYRLDQQVKFLHLQAEAESLLQQLKAIQGQRQEGPSKVLAESILR
jgi:hypothetical protein